MSERTTLAREAGVHNFVSKADIPDIENIINLLKPNSELDASCEATGINVLVLEDNEIDFEIMQRNLREMENYDAEIFHASDLEMARGIAECVNIDIALVDYCLGLDSGVMAINDIGGRCGDFAVIMVSGMPGREISQIALNAGAINHLDKNIISSILLETTIRSAIYTHRIERRLSNTILELERADRSKSNFFARMSHDLKTPLNAIIGYSEAISEGALGKPDSQAYQRGISSIHKAGTHLLKVINDLILQAHRESDDQTAPFDLVNLCDLVSASVEMVESFANSCEHTFKIIAKNDRLIAECQPALLQQALINILTNCVKYSPDGSTTRITISEESESCKVAIVDSGIGMSCDELKIAMQPYGRVKLPTKLSREGTGIGLSIVQQIVENHSGMMQVNSEPGNGTEVILKLPKVDAKRNAA